MQIWTWLFNSDVGFVNYWLERMGLDKVGWLTDVDVAMWSMVILTVWWTVGFNFLLYLSSLQAIPDLLYEAAEVDGAGPIRRFWSITIPQLRPIIVSMALLDLIWTSQQFALIWMTTGGGPLSATEMLSTFTYKLAFSEYDFSGASASAVIVLLLSMILAFFYVRSQRARD